jgi:hypothetical protein
MEYIGLSVYSLGDIQLWYWAEEQRLQITVYEINVRMRRHFLLFVLLILKGSDLRVECIGRSMLLSSVCTNLYW